MDMDPKTERKLLVWLAGILGSLAILALGAVRARHNHTDLLLFACFFAALAVVHLLVARRLARWPFSVLWTALAYTLPLAAVLRLVVPNMPQYYLLLPLLFVLLLQGFGAVRKVLLTHQFRRTKLNRMSWAGHSLEFARARGLDDLSLDVAQRTRYDLLVLVGFVVVGAYGFYQVSPVRVLLTAHLALSATLVVLAIAAHLAKNAIVMMAPGFQGLPVPESSTLEPNYIGVSLLIAQQAEPLVKPDDATQEAIIDYYDRCGEVRKLYFYDSSMLLLLGGSYVGLLLLVLGQGHRSELLVALGILAAIATALIQLPFFVGQKRLAMELTTPFSGSGHRSLLKLLEKESPSWTMLQVVEVLGAGVLGPGIIAALKYVGEPLIR